MECPFLQECCDGYKASAARIDRLYSELTHNQLTWKPAEERWSVVQCIEHLVSVRQMHLERLRAAVATGRAKGQTTENTGGGPPYGRGTLIGRLLLGSFSSTKKFKTTKRFQPDADPDAAETREAYRRSHESLIALAKDADGLDLGRIRVGAPPTPLVRLSLAQGFQLHVLHDARHLDQAERVRQEPGFPST